MFKNIHKNFNSNLKSIKLEGVGITVILLLVSIALVINIVRVVNKGKNNYEVYLYEKNLLEQLREDHQLLSEEYTFYTSEEAKKLLAREILGLAESNESLFRTKDAVTYYDIKPRILEVKEKESFSDWWKKLVM